MSASQSRKERQQQRAEGTDKHQIAQEKQAREKRKSTIKWTLISIVVILGVALVLVLNSNLFYTGTAAVTVGDTDYTTAEYDYFYKTAYYGFCSQNSSYLSYILDTSKPLDEQQYSDDGTTWADYFQQQALLTMQETTMLCDEAEKAGFTLSEEGKSSVQTYMESVDTAATNYGYDKADAYLAASYGQGVTRDLVEKLVTQSYIASEYSASVQESYTYTADELANYYTENAANFDTYEYAYYLVSAETDDSGNVTDEAKDKAKATADAIAEKDIQDLDSFNAAVREVMGEDAEAITSGQTAGALDNYPYKDFVTGEGRKMGDVTVVEGTNSGYYVVMYMDLNTNDYDTVNVRHILIKAEASEDGSYTDEAIAAAKTKAEELLAQWQAGDATEDSFAALAEEKSEDTGSNTNGGLYENVHKGQMVEEFDSFCFDESRKPGDTGIVYGNNGSYAGYHVVYFSGYGENYRNVLAESSMRSADYKSWEDGMLANYETAKHFAFRFAVK